MKKQILTTALILGLTSTPPVWAADNPSLSDSRGGQSQLSQSFKNLDSDGDGVLSEQEAHAAEVSFDQADTDGNGQISQSEYQKATGSGGAKQSEKESGW